MKTIVLLFVAAVPVLAQESPKPAKEHEWLKQLEGSWEFATDFGENMKSTGLQTDTMACGGLWLVMDAKETPADKKDAFHGHGVVGYDVAKKKFVSSWVDSMTTILQTMEGTVDKDGKVLTVVGEGLGMDGKPATQKWVIEVKDKDHKSLTFYVVVDKKDQKLGVIEYTRVKK